MSGRYLISKYRAARGEDPPIITDRTNILSEGEESFKISAQRNFRSVVLYDSHKDQVLKIAINGEPIHLARAIECVRRERNPHATINEQEFFRIKAEAIAAIENFARALQSREAVPRIGGAFVDHFTCPYYDLMRSTRDRVVAAKVAGGIWGGFSGAALGTIILPGIGTIIGSAIIGGWFGATGAGAIAEASQSRRKKCENCKGTGLVDDYRTCSNCRGYGYRM